VTGWLTTLIAPLLIYVQISPERLLVRDPKRGVVFDEPPEIALERRPKAKANIAGIGAAARARAGQPMVDIVNPFAHPRSLVSDFTVGEQLLKAAVQRLAGKWTALAGFFLSPRIVIHPLGDPAGGFTQVELRAFREMALGAGAGQVRICLGPPLTDQAVLSAAIRSGGPMADKDGWVARPPSPSVGD
jgi:rod shape-determining protein MreB